MFVSKKEEEMQSLKEILAVRRKELTVLRSKVSKYEANNRQVPTINSIEMSNKGLVTLRFSQLMTIPLQTPDYAQILSLSFLRPDGTLFTGRYNSFKGERGEI